MTYGFLFSLIAHVLIGLLLFVSIPSWKKDIIKNESVPLWIDLKNVEIADKTNLPLKTVEKNPKKEQSQKKTHHQVVHKFEEVKPVQKFEKIDDSASVVEKKKDITPISAKTKIKQKPQSPIKNTPQPKMKPVQEDEDLASLLTSVEKMSKKTTKQSSTDADVSDVVAGVLDGFKGGSAFSDASKPTVSQIDFIATTVRKYWNFDAGIDGIENMVVVLQVALNPDGHVAWVKIEDNTKFEQNASFRSVAESAKRAVYICDKLGEESPFRLLAKKYPSSYNEWQKMRLKFNPMDGGVS